MFERDGSKDHVKDDWDHLYVNISCFNVNIDFLKQHHCKTPEDWDSDDDMWDAIKSIVDAFDEPNGVYNFLNFLRGGASGKDHPEMYDTQGYRDAIARTYAALVKDPEFLSDNRRLAPNTKNV